MAKVLINGLMEESTLDLGRMTRCMGAEIWPDGARYEGQFNNDKRHGRGVFNYSGAKYEGEFRNERITGQGIHTENDGSSYSGSWRNDRPHGFGVEVEPNGGCYNGTWIVGKKHGKFTYSKRGIISNQIWAEDKLTQFSIWCS
jgi:hypothetical protein